MDAPKCNEHSTAIALLQSDMQASKLRLDRIDATMERQAALNLTTATQLATLAAMEKRKEDDKNPVMERIVMALLMIVAGAVGGGASAALSNALPK